MNKTKHRYSKVTFFLTAVVAIVIILLPVIASVSPPPVSDSVLVVGIPRWLRTEERDLSLYAFKEIMTLAGYREGENIIYKEEFSNQDAALHRKIVSDFVDNEVDLIFSLSSPGTRIAKEVTQSIPIIFTEVTYPKEIGLIAGLNSSGNNIVGGRDWVSEEKQIKTIKDTLPSLKTMGFIRNAKEPESEIQLNLFKKVGKELDITIIDIPVNRSIEIKNVLNKYTKQDLEAMYTSCAISLLPDVEKTIIQEMIVRKIPLISCDQSGIVGGSLMGLVADPLQVGRIAGQKALEIIKGARPAQLQTEIVPKPYLYVNLNTARAIGVTIPQTILARAKEVL